MSAWGGACRAVERVRPRHPFSRRDAIRLAMALAAASCAGRPTTPLAVPRPPALPLHLDPLVDIVPGAGLVWLVEARLADLWANEVVRRVATTLVAPARLDAFAAGHGGVDLRTARQFVAAGFPDSTLALVSAPVQAERIVAAFGSGAVTVDGQSIDHGVTRVWGRRGNRPATEELAIFGERAVGWERGRCQMLRVASLFAEGRLHRALPALHVEPLASASAAVGDAPIRAFAPGPFRGEYATGLGGLLRAATAVAATVRPGSRSDLVLHFALLGAWEHDAAGAADRLAAAFETLAWDPIGRLVGVESAIDGPHTWSQDGTLRLEVSLDANSMARGLHAAADASVEEMMSY